ncbi:MAG TPA: Spy/CpxP family protein refolding chaperone [Azonexus sp.]|jgi:hypothetical protein|nr:Spy/CpxP family protein refolding chaperone [Azonexus sp.]
MKQNAHQFTQASARLLAAAALAASLVFTSGAVLAADRVSHTVRAEQHAQKMHDKLMITQAQEEQWGKVAQVMAENAKTMDTLTQARADRAKEMTAVDDLKSYGEITDAHADGIKKLTPVFATLYASMSDPQKKVADTLFRHGDRMQGMHRHGHRHGHDHMKPDSK